MNFRQPVAVHAVQTEGNMSKSLWREIGKDIITRAASLKPFLEKVKIQAVLKLNVRVQIN